MKIIDISHILSDETPNYPGDYELSLTKRTTLERDCYTSYLLSTCQHTGTHIDMPMHLLPDDRMASDFPADRFIGKGVLLDVRGEELIAMKPRYERMVEKDSIVLLYTGFDQQYNSESYFTNHSTVSEELTNFLLSRKIKILGMDMPGPDYPPFPVHKALLANEIFILENLANLQDLLAIDSFEVMALPLKIKAEASFVRAVCKIL